MGGNEPSEEGLFGGGERAGRRGQSRNHQTSREQKVVADPQSGAIELVARRGCQTDDGETRQRPEIGGLPGRLAMSIEERDGCRQANREVAEVRAQRTQHIRAGCRIIENHSPGPEDKGDAGGSSDGKLNVGQNLAGSQGRIRGRLGRLGVDDHPSPHPQPEKTKSAGGDGIPLKPFDGVNRWFNFCPQSHAEHERQIDGKLRNRRAPQGKQRLALANAIAEQNGDQGIKGHRVGDGWPHQVEQARRHRAAEFDAVDLLHDGGDGQNENRQP